MIEFFFKEYSHTMQKLSLKAQELWRLGFHQGIHFPRFSFRQQSEEDLTHHQPVKDVLHDAVPSTSIMGRHPKAIPVSQVKRVNHATATILPQKAQHGMAIYPTATGQYRQN